MLRSSVEGAVRPRIEPAGAETHPAASNVERLGGPPAPAAPGHLPCRSPRRHPPHRREATPPMILNLRTDRPRPHQLYIGRPSKWGNPIRLRHEGERIRAVSRYRTDLIDRLRTGRVTRAELAEIYGRPLVCWCAPLACHGHVLLAIAEWAATQPDVGLDAATWTKEPIKRLVRRMRRQGARAA